MKFKFIICVTFTLFSYLSSSQSTFNMVRNGLDSSSLCNGTLYDHSGPTGNYFNGASDLFYITPPGGTLSLSFTAFNTENCCDRVWIYDGRGIGNLIGSYRGSALPNGGSPIAIPSGVATVRFTSDGSVTRSGFALTWTAGSSGTPTAQFSVSTTTPAVKAPVQFTNTSLNSGQSTWDFGDGNSSTDNNPSHSYNAPGTYQVRLIENSCTTADTSATQTITVQAFPTYTYTPATIADTVACNGIFRDTVTITKTGGGAFNYNATAQFLGQADLLNANFNTGIAPFTVAPFAGSNFSAAAVLGGASSGPGFLRLTGNSFLNNGLEAPLPQASVPTNLSFYTRVNTGQFPNSEVRLVNKTGTSYFTMFEIEIQSNAIIVRHRFGTFFQIITQGTWNHIEVENINYSSETFDVKINGVLAGTGLLFFNGFPANGVNLIDFNNFNSGGSIDFDEVRVFDGQPLANITFSPSSATISTNTTVDVPFTVDVNGLFAGLKNYELKFSANGSGLDSTFTVPLNLFVEGTPSFTSPTACFNFDTSYVGLTYSDSTLIFNTGCDTLRLNSLSSPNAAFTASLSQLRIAPQDSALLTVTYAPSSVGTFNDTLFLNGSNLDTTICLSGEVFLRPQIGFDSANYNITSQGCNDSIPFSFYLKNNGGATLNWNIPSGGNAAIFDDFENGFNSTVWSTQGSNAILQNPCYVRSGTASLSFNGFNREARTNPIFVGGTDSLTFWVRNGLDLGIGCENPDPGEVLRVEYRLTGNIFWTQLGIIPHFSSAPIRFSALIPTTGLVEVRLIQTQYNGNNFDNYLVDDFAIGSGGGLSSVSPNSGNLSALDSILVSGYVNVNGLSSGVYNRSVKVNSNDPAHADTLISLNVTVNGAPSLNLLPNTCKVVDTVFTGGVVNDSILVYNSGCDSLQLSSFSFSNSYFTIDTLSATISPQDSLWLPLSFSPSANQLGLLQDTLVITNNDTLTRLCVEGVALGAPAAVLNPDSLSFNVTDCGGLITDTVYLSNNGLSALDFKVVGAGNVSGGNAINVLLYGANASFTEYNNVNTLLTAESDFNVSVSNAFNNSQFDTDLQGKDVVVFPENSQSTFTLQSFAPSLQTFVDNGGVVIMLASVSSRVDALGLMDVGNSGFLASPFTVDVPNHPVVQGLPNTISNLSATRGIFITDLTDVTQLVATNGSACLVAAKTHNLGASVYIGYDYFATDINIENMLRNSVRWSRSLVLPNNITLSPDSGQVATSDSTAIAININSAGLNNGTYDYRIQIETNDPAQPIIELPVHLVINGSEKIALVDSACVNFAGTLQGALATDTVRVTNDGCDTLTLNSFTGAVAEFSILNLPIVLAPGDTTSLEVQFAPLTVGSFSDTLILNNSDTAIGICVSATSAGAPFIQIPEDTIFYELNKCKIVGSRSLKILNQGQGGLNFNLEIGRYTSPVSTQTYNTSSATTQHNFTGLPTSADSIIVEVVLNGDFDAWNENAVVTGDFSFIGNVGVTSSFYQPDTFLLFVTGTQANNMLSDGNLNISVDNTFRVDGGAGSFHQVRLTIVQSVNWVSVAGANAGTIPANDSISRNLLFNSALLPVGRYSTTLNAISNSPSTPVLTKPIVFNVISEPELVLSDTCAFYALTRIGDTAIRTISIYNDGCQPLNVTSLISSSPQFKVSPANGLIPVGDSLSVSISFIPATVGTFNASIILSSNDTNRVICLFGQADADPIADFSFNDENICIGEVSFVNNSQFFSSLLWDFGDGTTSNQSNVIHAFSLPGTYQVRLRASNAIGSDTISKLVTVNPLVVDFGIAANDTIQLQDTAFFSDSSSSALSWQWDFGDGNSSNVQNPSHKYNAQGRFEVRLTVTDQRNCSQSTVKPIWVENKIGLEELALVSSLKVYPNPSKGIFNLKAHAGFSWQGVQLEIRDAQGRIVHRAQAENAAIQLIDISHLATGLYHLGVTQVKAGKTITVNRKLVLE